MGVLATMAMLTGSGIAAAAVSPIGAHSMLQLDDPPSFMRAMFAEASAMGASSIRLDVAPALVFAQGSSDPDWSGLDDVMSLSEQYAMPVEADLVTVPSWLAGCPQPMSPSDAARCAPDDLGDYGELIGRIVAHADPVILDWEVWNEPDSSQFFHGTPTQYAWMLRTAHDAIKRADPRAQVLLGGISDTAGSTWLSQVLAVPGADAGSAFDIANVHERGALDALAGDIRAWRAYFAAAGFTGPLWVTEHSYPADPAFQYDPAYGAGAASQAAYLTASLPTLLDAGASRVFVTERDNLGGQFASEGVLGGNVADPPVPDPRPVPRPAFAAVAAVAGCYAMLGRDCSGRAPVAGPAALAMPDARLDRASQATVTVTDPGPGPAAFGAASLVGGGPAVGVAVTQDRCSGAILEPGSSCVMTVRFTPASAGSVWSILQIPSDQGTVTVPVSATSPSVSSLSASAVVRVSGGPDGVGHPQRLSVLLSNPLDGPVRIGSVQATGAGFSVVVDGCAGVSLPAGAHCVVTMQWRSSSPGRGDGTLALRGDGAPLDVAVRPTAYALPRVTALRSARGGDCLAPAGGLVWATVDQAASVTWTMRRSEHARDLRCGRRSRATGAAPAGGRHAALRVSGHRRAGTYRLSATAANRHGRGPSRTLWLTVP
jgi:hypothetical protein